MSGLPGILVHDPKVGRALGQLAGIIARHGQHAFRYARVTCRNGRLVSAEVQVVLCGALTANPLQCDRLGDPLVAVARLWIRGG